ncbi:MAG: DUF2909 domain-containing protein [Steroidobacteraceae bacterium]
MIKLLIVACLIGIVISLGTGLFHLVSSKGASSGTVRALTIRIVLSVALFLLLLLAWSQGMIQPHGLGR